MQAYQSSSTNTSHAREHATTAATSPTTYRVKQFLDPTFVRQVMGERISKDALNTLLTELENMWTPETNPSRFYEWAVNILEYEFKINGKAITINRDFVENDPALLKAMYDHKVWHAHSVYTFFQHHKFVGNATEETLVNEKRFSKVLETIRHTYYTISDMHMGMRVTQETHAHPVPDVVSMFRYRPLDLSKTNKYQNLIIYLEQQLTTLGYRRYRGQCYEEIVTVEGYRTRAWRPVCEVKEFIYRSIDKNVNFSQWDNLTTAKGNAEAAERYLLTCQDSEFRDLKPDRHVFSFKNGIYNALANAFHLYTDKDIPADLTACNYIDMECDEEDIKNNDWYNIATPVFQSILTYQQLPPEVCRWIYAFLGRNIYNVGDLDTWQVLMFIKGVAGSGKSTLGKIAARFYNQADVAVISSNIEEKFGLAPIADKFMFVCLEVKEKFGLNQADLQSMISGEEMSIATKFKDAKQRTWTVPGMFFGNELANWIDAAGSMSRRLVVVEFNQLVKDGNPNMFQEMLQELPRLIVKCNSAYQDMYKKYGAQDIWKVLPPYFHDTKKRVKCAVNALSAFMDSGDIVVESDSKMPLKKFREMYRTFCINNSYERSVHKLNQEQLTVVFHENKITMEPHIDEWEGRTTSDNWCFGIRPRREGEVINRGTSAAASGNTSDASASGAVSSATSTDLSAANSPTGSVTSPSGRKRFRISDPDFENEEAGDDGASERGNGEQEQRRTSPRSAAKRQRTDKQ